MAKDKFYRGSTTFKCVACKRTTRDTGDNGGCELCPECYDLGGIENSISDGAATREECDGGIRKLVAEVAKKGGDVSCWNASFGLNGSL